MLLTACTEETGTDLVETQDIQGIVAATSATADKHDVSQFEEFELQEVIDGLSL